jgi:hypothetical protein
VRTELATIMVLPRAASSAEGGGDKLARTVTAPPTPTSAVVGGFSLPPLPRQRGVMRSRAGSDGDLGPSCGDDEAAAAAAEAEREGLMVSARVPRVPSVPPPLPAVSRQDGGAGTDSAGGAGGGGLLARQMSGLAAGITELARQVSVKEEFLCPVCFCNELVENSIRLPCHHRFCRECVACWCTTKVNDNILHVTCPDLSSPTTPRNGGGGGGGGPDIGCPQQIDEALLLEVVEPETAEKYHRFQAKAADKNLRECPKCSSLSAPRKGWVYGVYPDMVCPGASCGHSFCYHHSDAHPGRTCREYELSRREEEAQNKRSMAKVRTHFCVLGLKISNG